MDLDVEGYIEIFKKGIEAIEGMDKILEILSEKYFLATLINEGSEWANYKLDISGFGKYFKKRFISGDLNIAKPNPEIYKIVFVKFIPYFFCHFGILFSPLEVNCFKLEPS